MTTTVGTMFLIHDCLDAVCFWLRQPKELLQAMVVCRDWCTTIKTTNVWQHVFIRYWVRRQKPGFIRACWKELVDQGLARSPGISITAFQSRSAWHEGYVEPEPLATFCDDSSTSWYQKFTCSAKDALVRRAPTKDELCYDTCVDEFSERPFPRCWLVVNGDGLEGLPHEIQFHPDGEVVDHDRSQTSIWTWKWVSTHGSFLELTRMSDTKVVVFRVARAADAGFVLRGVAGREISSRELTLEEHIYRRYSGTEGYRVFGPAVLENTVRSIASNSGGPNVRMPRQLTHFECRYIRSLAARMGLRTVPKLNPRGPGVTIIHDPTRPTEQAIMKRNAIEWSSNSVTLHFWFSQKAMAKRLAGLKAAQHHSDATR